MGFGSFQGNNVQT